MNQGISQQLTMAKSLGTTPVTSPPTATALESSRGFRVLFCCWTELDITSGTPVVVADMMKHFGPGQAEAFVELNVDNKQHRLATDIKHPINKYRLHARLWPFRLGHRVRTQLARLGLPILVVELIRHIRRFRPDCLFVIYAQPHWILATWLASRLTGVPLVYHIHDAFLEVTERRKRSRFSRWLERMTLTTRRALALDEHMAEHYERRYGIKCTILRHIVRRAPMSIRTKSHPAIGTGTGYGVNGSVGASKEMLIGFAGAIYDSNARQLAELCRLVGDDPTLRLRIRTGSRPAELQSLGICGPRVEVGYAPDYDCLLRDLAQCDLLYLPLHFDEGIGRAAGAMEFSLPTKSFDYLLTGTPILAHCPEEFSLSRFFTRFPCGYVLNDPRSEAVKSWLDYWRADMFPPLDDAVRLQTLAMYTPAENKRILWRVLAEEVDRAITRKTDG
jgi:Glycosyltransferase Family 4